MNRLLPPNRTAPPQRSYECGPVHPVGGMSLCTSEPEGIYSMDILTIHMKKSSINREMLRMNILRESRIHSPTMLMTIKAEIVVRERVI